MKTNWQTKKLGDLFDITSSKRVFKSEWKKSGVPFYRAREIVKLAKYGSVNNELFISEEMFKQYSEKYGAPKENDIMITGVGTLGICYIVKKNDKFYFKDGNIIWLKNKNLVNSKFIEYLFKSDIFINLISNTSGATVGTFTIIKAKNMPVVSPPLPEQHRIVKILDEVFADVAKAKENAEKNLQNSKELFESYLQSVFANPGESWEEKKLGDVFQIKPPKKEAQAKLKKDDLVSFVPMENLGIGRKDLILEKERKLRDVVGSYTYFANNDVLLAKITPCFENGKLGIASNLKNGVGFGSSEYIVFRTNGEVLPDYLYYFLARDEFRKKGAQRMSGAVGHKRVSKEFVEKSVLLFPKKIAEQKSIVAKLDSLSAETKKLEEIYIQKLANLEELKKSVLKKAFSGEL